MTRARRDAVLVVPGRCELSCPVCECEGAVRRSLAGTPERVLIRGATQPGPALWRAVDAARSAGATDVVVRTNGIAWDGEQAAVTLAQRGATAVRVPLFSHAAPIHDRIAGRREALVRGLVGLRSLAAAGLNVEVELPLLAPRFQDMDALAWLARRSVARVHAFAPVVPAAPRAAPLSAAWPEVRAALEVLARHAQDAGALLRLGPAAGIVPCALPPSLHSTTSLDRRKRDGRVHPAEPCDACALRARCPGVPAAHFDRHGALGLAPFADVPDPLRPRRNGKRRWDAGQRASAAQAELLVLRPTVSCNQDCTFCSAGETSQNVWESSATMLRAIARAARRGVTHLSFSGGEPTLAPALVDWVAAARRLGIAKIELVTNGVLVTEARARALWEAGLTHAFVSLHAADEARSAAITRKRGDFARTVAGIGHLSGAGVRTSINHVICSQNVEQLEDFVRFVHARFGGHVMLSFAFVTPQYKALDDLSQLPRLSVVAPHLRRALRAALALGQPVSVGSRQGVPPCLLGEFRAWSDALYVKHAAQSEDAAQKTRAPECDSCRYTRLCTGVWKPYAERYGLGELAPIIGPPLSDAEQAEFVQRFARTPWGVPKRFDEVPDSLRDRDAEGEVLAEPVAAAPRRLPLIATARQRPLRALLVGAGRRAKALAKETAAVADLEIAAVASPSGPAGAVFARLPAFRDVRAAIAAQRPDVLLIAAATAAHAELVALAVEYDLPALIEKPLCASEDEARRLAALARDTSAPLMPAHQLRFLPGLDQVLVDGPLALRRRVPRAAPDAPRHWHRRALFETLHHWVALVAAQAHGEPLEVVRVAYAGEARPQRLQIEMRHVHGTATLDVDFDARDDALELTNGALQFRRGGVATQGSDVATMLSHVAQVVRGTAQPKLDVNQAVTTLIATRAIVHALADAGAPFDRPGAPRRAASPGLRDEV